MEKIPVAVLGATGSVGQRFVSLLVDHPWFELRTVGASDRSAGKTYAEAANWVQTEPMPASVAEMKVAACEPARMPTCPLVFSALDSSVAGEVEAAFAAAGHLVVTNAKNHRMDPRVPLLVPEVNAGHLDLVADHTRGAILANPNCATIGLVMALKPLVDRFGVEQVHVVTMQALSGAGVPGVSSMHSLDNVIPYIGGEEDKLETEVAKILGTLDGGSIESRPIAVSAACNRVSVLDGHLECVSVKLAREAEPDELIEAWNRYQGEPQERGLPSAPKRPVIYLEAPDAPQPRLHRDLESGMATTVGRVRPCPLFDFKFVALSHNTLRGAAGGALLVAELAVARGLLPRD